MKKILFIQVMIILIRIPVSAAEPGGAALAWIRFEKAAESFAGKPYIFLGKQQIDLKIEVKPSGGQVIDLLWGSKNDQRTAAIAINGRTQKIVAGGYNGFQWQRMPVPANTKGDSCQVTIKQADGKAAFIAEIRLTDPNGKPVTSEEMKKAAHKTTLQTKAVSGNTANVAEKGREAFPEMQKLWDTPAPPPTKPLDDKQKELAFRQAELHVGGSTKVCSDAATM